MKYRLYLKTTSLRLTEVATRYIPLPARIPIGSPARALPETSCVYPSGGNGPGNGKERGES